MTVKKLKDLIISEQPEASPTSVDYKCPHVEWIVAIGNDHTATVTMTEEAFEELKRLTLDYNDS